MQSQTGPDRSLLVIIVISTIVGLFVARALADNVLEVSGFMFYVLHFAVSLVLMLALLFGYRALRARRK